MQPGPIPLDQGGLDFLSPADPGIGNQNLATVPASERWRVWAVAFTLTTTAAAVNRTIGLEVAFSLATVIYVTSTTFQAPSTTQRHHCVNNWPLGSGGIGNDKIFPGAWPILLPPGGEISANIINFTFGDLITNIRILRERWLQP